MKSVHLEKRTFGNLEIQARVPEGDDKTGQWVRLVLTDPEHSNPNRVLSGIGAGDWRERLSEMDPAVVATALFGESSFSHMNKEPLPLQDRPIEELDGMRDASGIPRSSAEWADARARRAREAIDPREAFIEEVWAPAIIALREEIMLECDLHTDMPCP